MPFPLKTRPVAYVPTAADKAILAEMAELRVVYCSSTREERREISRELSALFDSLPYEMR